METKNYLFDNSLDGFSKCLFTIIPIVLAFNNILNSQKNPLDTRISFFVAIFSLFFYYILEFQKVRPRYIKVFIFSSFIFLSISYILEIVVFKEVHYEAEDVFALVAFIFAICPLIIQTFIVFIQIDLYYIESTKKSRQSSPLQSVALNKKSGKLIDACENL